MPIDFDVETTGLQAYSGKNEAFLWIFSDGERHEAIPFSPSGAAIETWGVPAGSDQTRIDNHRRIQEWFDRGKAAGIRCWNTKFDRGFADMAGCFSLPEDGLWHDAMVEAHTIDERRSLALKAVASQLFGEDAADPQKKLKTWLNSENARRAKVLKDAEKAAVGSLRIKYVDENGKNKTRKADENECAAVVAEADDLRDENGEYRRANYSHVPREIMEPYALEDVILTRRASDVYAPRLAESPDLAGTVEFERKAMDALYAIEKRGLPSRDEEYRKLEQEVIQNLSALSDTVMELAAEGDPVVYAKQLAGNDWGKGKKWVDLSESGKIRSYEGGAAQLTEFNAKSSAQILAALKARGANMEFMTVKDGKVSADADNLRAVDDELAAAILNFRSEYKVLSTYVRPMIGRSYVSSMNIYKEPFIAPDGRIHANYRQIGAQKTGRMSCSDPNMQNQPRDDLRLRYNIVADPGYKLISCDLSNVEMVLFAAYCGKGRLLDAVNNGEDLHVLTAKMLALRDRARPGGVIETARQLGKVYNFTRIYGGGLRSIRRYFRCSLDEARILKRRFDEAYPEVGRLQNRIEYSLDDNGYIQDKLISGRRYRVAMQDSYKATNYLVQGTAASLLKYAVIKLHEDGIPMVALIHDEIVAHVPEKDAPEAARLIEQRMVEFEGLKGIVPLRAEAEIIDRWSDAKKLKDDSGREYMFTPQWAGGEKRYVKETI